MATAMGRGRVGDPERGFFLGMAIAMAITVLAGFGLQFGMGRSSFASPWWVHVHALTFMGWVALYVAQNILIFRDDLVLHRRLGRFAALWALWMVPVGLLASPLSVATGRYPPFFEPSVFIAMNTLTILTFASLTVTAVSMRNWTGWHRRLMLCGTAMLMGPAWGRLLPIPFMGTWIIWAVFVPISLYVIIAVAYDWRRQGSAHPAYYWGGGAMLLTTALMRPIGLSPPMLAFVAWLTH